VIVGLTGAVGAGKSTVAAFLAQRGFQVIDVDVLAAKAALARGVSPGDALLRVLEGDSVLEALLLADVKSSLAAWAETTTGNRVIDSALLFEHGLDRLCDVTVCLTCPLEERRRRVGTRSTTSASHFDRIEGSQLSEAEKAHRAHHVIRTDQPVAEVERAVNHAIV
jgi:dephospho-CoA kinase